MSTANTSPNFSDRVRFNWGFHDGSYDHMRRHVRDVSQHFDAVYAAAYRAGQAACEAAGQRPETSDAAWAAYMAQIKQ